MGNALFSLIYTSARPQCIWNRCHAWLLRANNPALIETVITTDVGNYAAMKAAQFAKADLHHHDIRHVVQTDPDGDCVKGWNLAAKLATGKVLVQVSDDFSPPHNWDSLLTNLSCSHGGTWWEHDHAVHVNDGFVVRIMTSAIITRARYDKFGYFYFPEYKSMFADTELTEVAYRDGVVIDAKHLLFKHSHYNCQSRSCDSVDAKHGSRERWNTAEALFNQRKSMNFRTDAAVK